VKPESAEQAQDTLHAWLRQNHIPYAPICRKRGAYFTVFHPLIDLYVIANPHLDNCFNYPFGTLAAQRWQDKPRLQILIVPLKAPKPTREEAFYAYCRCLAEPARVPELIPTLATHDVFAKAQEAPLIMLFARDTKNPNPRPIVPPLAFSI